MIIYRRSVHSAIFFGVSFPTRFPSDVSIGMHTALCTVESCRPVYFDCSTPSRSRHNQFMSPIIPLEPYTDCFNQRALPSPSFAEHAHQQVRILCRMDSKCMVANYSEGAGLLLVEAELSND